MRLFSLSSQRDGIENQRRTIRASRLAPPDAVAAKAMFLSIYGDGQAYTESEYRGWLRAAGLVDIQRRELAGGYSIIHGRKA